MPHILLSDTSMHVIHAHKKHCSAVEANRYGILVDDANTDLGGKKILISDISADTLYIIF